MRSTPEPLARRAALGLLAAMALAFAGACADRHDEPATSADAAPADAAPRVVAFSPAIGVILRHLGLEDLAVARHTYDLALDPALPSVGDQITLDYEALLRVRPTHIFMQWGARPVPGRLEQMAQERGWAVRSYPLDTLDDIRAAAADLWAALAPPEADPAHPIFAEMDRAWSRRGGGFAGAGRILLLASAAPPSALGPGSFHHQVLEAIGGTPALAEGTPYIRLDTESLLRLAPDGIVLVLPRAARTPDPGPPTPEQLRSLLGRAADLDIPAVRRGRLALIDDPLALTPSTAMIDFGDDLAAILERWNTE